MTSAVVRLAPRKAPPQTLVDDKTFFRVDEGRLCPAPEDLTQQLKQRWRILLRISYTLSWQNAGWTGPSEASNFGIDAFAELAFCLQSNSKND